MRDRSEETRGLGRGMIIVLALLSLIFSSSMTLAQGGLGVGAGGEGREPLSNASMGTTVQEMTHDRG